VLLTVNDKYYCIGSEPIQFSLDEISEISDSTYGIDKKSFIKFLKNKDININNTYLITSLKNNN
jgi:hypothetical protein